MTATRLALLALVLLGSAASANSLTATFAVRGDVEFLGSAEGAVDWVGSMQDGRLQHGWSEASFHVDGHAWLRTYTAAEVEREYDSPLGREHRIAPLGHNDTDLGPVQGQVRVVEPRGPFSVRLLPTEPSTLPLIGSFTLSPRQDIAWRLADTDATTQASGVSEFFPGAGAQLGVQSLAFPDGYTGRLAVTGALVQLPESLVDTAWRTTGAFAPVAGGGQYREAPLLVIEGTIRPATPLPAADWFHSVQGLQAALAGDLLLRNAQGSGTLNSTPLPSGVHLFQGIGDLNATADYRGTAADWRLDGEPVFVATNARPMLDARAVGLSTVGLGLIAAVLAFLTGRLQELAGFVVGKARRLTKADPFRSPARQQILATIHQHQPVTMQSLKAQTGLSRTALAYHLRVMLAYDVLQTVTPGVGDRNRVYMLNSNSMRFPVPAAPDPSGLDALASEAMAAVNSHPDRRWIYEAVKEGPLDFAGLAERRASQGLERMPQSSASYHLKALVEAGALAVGWQAGRKVYRLAVDEGDVRVEQYRRLLRQIRAVDVVRSLAAGNTVRHDDEALRRLAELGLATRLPGGKGFELQPFLRDIAPRL